MVNWTLDPDLLDFFQFTKKKKKKKKRERERKKKGFLFKVLL